VRLIDSYFARRRCPEWGWFRVGAAIVCVPKKCGSTSFRFALLPKRRMSDFLSRYRPMTNEEAKSYGLPCYLAVRDPVSRFASFYSTVQRATDFKPLRGLSPDRLLDVIEPHLHEDAHWQPQADYLITTATLVPYTRLLELLELPPVWAERSERKAQMPETRILSLYAKDAELWATR
jgi:hypothetical protein